MMPTREELARRYRRFSNEKLLEVVFHRADYTDEALATAQAEIDRRSISAEEVDAFLDKKQWQREQAKKISRIPLTSGEKLFFFFAWFTPGFIRVALGMNYSEVGMILKSRQSRFFSIAGFLSFLLTIIFSMRLIADILTTLMIFVVLMIFTFYADEKITSRQQGS